MSAPDFVAYARQLGLTQVLYPAVDAFAVLGVSKSFGWEKLVATGELPVVRLSGSKRGRTLTMIKAVDMAALIYRREQAASTPRSIGSEKRRNGVNAALASDRDRPARPDDGQQDANYPRPPRPGEAS